MLATGVHSRRRSKGDLPRVIAFASDRQVIRRSSWVLLTACLAVGVTVVAIARIVPRPITQGTHPADPFAWGALVSGAVQLSAEYVVLGLAHVAYLIGLAVLGATVLTALSRSADHAEGRFVSVFAGLRWRTTAFLVG
jgi:hypothetical protein